MKSLKEFLNESMKESCLMDPGSLNYFTKFAQQFSSTFHQGPRTALEKIEQELNKFGFSLGDVDFTDDWDDSGTEDFIVFSASTGDPVMNLYLTLFWRLVSGQQYYQRSEGGKLMYDMRLMINEVSEAEMEDILTEFDIDDPDEVEYMGEEADLQESVKWFKVTANNGKIYKVQGYSKKDVESLATDIKKVEGPIKEDEDPCWDDYEQYGTKMKNGKKVPNCVPKESLEESSGDKEEYQKFFKAALKRFGVTEPDQLKGDKKKEFFNYVDKNWDADNETDLDESSKIAGWIAFYNGKKLEIKKSEADSLYGAKKLAIKHFKTPKSKESLIAIKPAYNESLSEEMTDAQEKRKEEIVKELKKKEDDFKERYGDKWKEVMYATAVKLAKNEPS